MTSLKQQAIKGTVWTFFGYGLSQVVRLANNLILTRLLAPEMFGLMALVNIFRVGLELFTDIGIVQNIIQSKRGEDLDFLDTAWTIQVIRGFVIWFGICLISWPVATFYEDPRLTLILPVTGLTSLFSAFQTVRVHVLRRNIELGKITLIDLSRYVFLIIVMIVVALISPTIWALVIGTVFGGVYQMVMSYVICPGPRHRFMLEEDARQEIAGFGFWIFLTSIFMFLGQQSDRLILGKLIPIEVFGVFSIAVNLAQLPTQVMLQLNSKVIFPVVSRQSALPRPQLRKNLVRPRTLLLLTLFLVFIPFVCFGDLIIGILLDDRYQQAGWMLPVLMLGNWFTMVNATSSSCLMGIGKPSYTAKSRGFVFLFAIVSVNVGFQLLGLLGAIIAVSFIELPIFFYLEYVLHKEGIGTIWQDLALTVMLYSLLFFIIFVRGSLGFGSPFAEVPIG